MPMGLGKRGSGRLRAWSNRPSAQLSLELLERRLKRAEPSWRSTRLRHELVLAARGVHRQAPEHEDLQAILEGGSARGGHASEHHAAELGQIVLEAEVGVPRARGAEDC